MTVNINDVNEDSSENTYKKVNNKNKIKILYKQLCITFVKPVFHTY